MGAFGHTWNSKDGHGDGVINTDYTQEVQPLQIIVDDSVKDRVNIDENTIFATPDYNPVTEFERRIAEFFGAPYAVAVDSCTHGIELCLRLTKAQFIDVPHNTYLSVAMLAEKLNIERRWFKLQWEKLYYLTNRVIDAATLWERNSYRENTFMCVSFQYAKHLSIGRCAVILCDNKAEYNALKLLSHDGRQPDIPWRNQDVKSIGFHYYCTPETCQIGLNKLDAAIIAQPKIWSYLDYPSIKEMTVFKNEA